MRKSKKQMVMAAAACAMMGVMAIGGTMAYLTDRDRNQHLYHWSGKD